ncbi:MAG: hypothetical protein ACLUI3_12435 [Christensenellales bacterium]
MIHIALVPGAGGKLQPRVLTLRQILDQYIGFQKDVVERRTRFDLRRRATVRTFWRVSRSQPTILTALLQSSASKNEAEAERKPDGKAFWIDQIALLGIVDGSEHFEFHSTSRRRRPSWICVGPPVRSGRRRSTIVQGPRRPHCGL